MSPYLYIGHWWVLWKLPVWGNSSKLSWTLKGLPLTLALSPSGALKNTSTRYSPLWVGLNEILKVPSLISDILGDSSAAKKEIWKLEKRNSKSEYYYITIGVEVRDIGDIIVTIEQYLSLGTKRERNFSFFCQSLWQSWQIDCCFFNKRFKFLF